MAINALDPINDERQAETANPNSATQHSQASVPQIAASSRPSRNLERLNYKSLHRGNFAGATETSFSYGEPKSYEEAVQSRHSADWQQGMRSEYDSHIENKTWHLEKLPTGKKILPGRWVYRLKPLPDGGFKHKARWVVKGFAQSEGDYDETFATVVRANTTMTLFALTTQHGWNDEMMDVVTAFLNSNLKEDIWMEQPQGFEEGNGLVCKLEKTLYGLKQSPRAWYDTLSGFLMSLDFVKSNFDHGLFIHAQAKTYISVYVDDIRIIGPNKVQIDIVKQKLSSRFKMTDLGATRRHLGVDVKRNPLRASVTLTQSTAVLKLLDDYGMTSCRPVKTPMDPSAIIVKSPDHYEPQQNDITKYRSCIGRLNHIATHTRPDIAYAASKLGRYAAKPSDYHWQAVKRVLRYLAGTPHVGITYSNSAPNSGILAAWTDASYGCDVDDGRSTSGYIFILYGGPISWFSKKQDTVATSTTHAEYIAQYYATGEALWLRGLLGELGVTIKAPTKIFADNIGAIKLASNPEFHKKTKHIAIKYHMIREWVEKGSIYFEYLETAKMTADGLTKPLTPEKHEIFTKLMGMTEEGGE
jgi:hypothetical protein